MPAVFSVAVMILLSQTALAQAPRTLVRVEEDWVALVAQPDFVTCSPQILHVISPSDTMDGAYALVEVNHRSYPSFQEGGVQVQGWMGSSLSGTANSEKTASLYRSSDKVRYTIAMEKADGGILFELKNGRSRTWGRFAQSGVSVIVPVSNPSLDAYSPDFSVGNTGVNLGAHRVELLYMTALRRTYSDGATETDDSDRVIHRYQLSVEDVPLAAYEDAPDDYNIFVNE